MAELNYNFYDDDSGYTDGGIEVDLYNKIEDGMAVDDIIAQDNRWPVFYHLSPKRENILSWYPFKKDARILEIGSGCGALTELLCDHAKEVVSVELTKQRALVNYARNKDKDNLEIIVGNFNNMVFDEKFDYIILNGVLEYAQSFSQDKKPDEAFLEKMKKLLKEDGILLIAIENRLGLKYFNGVPEDHTARLFSGLNNYPDTDTVQTYSKQELIDLLNRVGFTDLKFYYPVPDYKFPQAVYTDDSMGLVDSRVQTDTFNTNRVWFFDESEVLQTLLDEQIGDHFLNSFLVAASLKPVDEDETILFTKFSDRYKKPFRIKTTLKKDEDGQLRFYKQALLPEGEKHVERMADYFEESDRIGDFYKAPLRREEKGISFDYIKGSTLEDKLLDLLREGKYEQFEKEIKDFADMIYEGSQVKNDYFDQTFEEYFGDHPLREDLHVKSGANFDMIFPNIIHAEDGKDYVIDYEWIFDFDIPQEYVIWRALYYLIELNSLQNTPYSIQDLMELAGIDPSLHETFVKWDDHFGNTFILDKTENVYKNRTIDAVPYLTEMIGTSDTKSSLYLDFGQGYTEEFRIFSDIVFDAENFEVSFDLEPVLERAPGRLRHIRWDPLERACQLKDLKVHSNTGEVELYEFEAGALDRVNVNDWLCFVMNDPQLDILGDYEGLKEITITGKMKFLNTIEALEVAETLRYRDLLREEDFNNYKAYNLERDELIRMKDTHIHNQEDIIDDLRNTIASLSQALEETKEKLKEAEEERESR